MDGCFENRIAASDDVGTCQMHWDIGLYANTDELSTVRETVVLRADTSGTATGQFER